VCVVCVCVCVEGMLNSYYVILTPLSTCSPIGHCSFNMEVCVNVKLCCVCAYVLFILGEMCLIVLELTICITYSVDRPLEA